MARPLTLLRSAAVLPLALLAGCDMVVMNPMGDVALQQRNLVIFATALMLLIVIPVIALVGIFAWKYRASNQDAAYDPDWDHSTALELVIWSAPLLIVICLGAVTWTGTHLLDPYRPIERIAKHRPVASGVKPLEVQVVALDWKWLFIYPEYGFATVNELAAPVDRPIRFRLTSSSVMNAFYVPTLAGMIYTMPSMETKLHAVINKQGDYAGFSANYSGAGFSGMRFRFYGMDDRGFADWVARNKAGQGALNRATYLQLEKPSEKVPVMRFASADPGLFDAVVNQCVRPGTTCMNQMMRRDAGDPAAMKTMPGMAAKPQPHSPLTGGDAGEAPPKNPRDIQQRSNASPSNPTTM
ncbi:cytochrome o ubiquinol oxidase subunit 2 [Sphingomonas jinjuensis]|uniref:Ubiquinol oxidase subunit 2 n=1 Tax=Sphingomonas jinjuensis TaxID=535907 RepID=A0A840FER3_9SPHN|nr:ubiquinol oxidase subunit II [Sphingomonas jinjuensis]MBB4155341.1 cytochrome o ubiquinol oxidase subunit 2 [Sphingomonas jinjuensis]